MRLLDTMFRWCKGAEVCLLYLCDVEREDDDICATDERSSWNDRSTPSTFWMGNDEYSGLPNPQIECCTSGLRAKN